MSHFNLINSTAPILLIVCVSLCLLFFLRMKKKDNLGKKVIVELKLLTEIISAIYKPFLFIFFTYVVYFCYVLLVYLFDFSSNYFLVEIMVGNIVNIALASGFFWLFLRLSNVSSEQLRIWAVQNNFKFGVALAPLLKNSLPAIVSLMLFNVLLPFLAIPLDYYVFLEKSTTILLSIVIAWLVVQLINAVENYFLMVYPAANQGNLTFRRIYTQTTIIKKILISLVVVIALAVILLAFDRVRELGAALLASAGLVAAVGAFAAQKTLASVFAGLQIAFTQPIKINDEIVVENEFGTIEEINLNYVVVKLWDWRRLIMPTNYFIEKSFQNWTRSTSNLIGSVMLYVDFRLPIDEIRAYFNKVLAGSTLWDGQVNSLQVTDIKEYTMEVRLLMSAADAGKTFDLRCEVREKMLAYLVEYYPDCLPHMRMERVAPFAKAAVLQ